MPEYLSRNRKTGVFAQFYFAEDYKWSSNYKRSFSIFQKRTTGTLKE